MTPRTSFVVPVRDGAATLGDALASLVAQTDADHEIVVVDDGSTDGTPDVIAAWAGRDPRVRGVRLPPTGIVGALNAGLEAARGRYVARMDADDLAAPDRLSHQLPLLDADPRLGVVDGQVRFFRDGDDVPEGMTRYGAWLNGVITPEDFDRALLVESPVAHPAATFRRADVLALGGYRDGPFPEDYDLWLRFHAAGFRLQKVPRVLVHMRDRPRRLTRTDPRYGRDGFDRVRRDWLAATALSEPRRVLVVGGGRTGRRWVRWLQEAGHVVPAVIDVAGRAEVLGVPVRAPDDIGRIDADCGLVSVGSRGARDAVRALIGGARPGWREGRDWWAVI